MSNYLAVDTSSRYLTVAACKGGNRVVSHLADCAMNHSVALMDEIDKALDKVGLDLKECDFFAAVTGPGSFTGIRIGIACVKGYAVALKKRAFGVTAFDLISYNVNSDCDYLVAVDAAHGNYYVSGYSPYGFCNVVPRFLPREKVIEFGLPVYGFENLDLPDYTKLEAKDCLCRAVETASKYDDDGLRALYVKKSQAEEERAARLGIV